MKFQKTVKNKFLFLFFICMNNLHADDPSANDSQIIQPGAPGMPSIILNKDEATNIANSSSIESAINGSNCDILVSPYCEISCVFIKCSCKNYLSLGPNSCRGC